MTYCLSQLSVAAFPERVPTEWGQSLTNHEFHFFTPFGRPDQMLRNCCQFHQWVASNSCESKIFQRSKKEPRSQDEAQTPNLVRGIMGNLNLVDPVTRGWKNWNVRHDSKVFTSRWCAKVPGLPPTSIYLWSDNARMLLPPTMKHD